jgi:hypothetical protein
MSIHKAKKPNELSSQSPKRKTPSRLTATLPATFARSKKISSNPSPVPATPVDCPNWAAEPYRTLIADHRSPLLDLHNNFVQWSQLNLIISINYGKSTFSVRKNRWGALLKDVPIDWFVVFLYNPQVRTVNELHMDRWLKQNEHAVSGSDI